ncbi:MAG: bifunctional DNA-formamidopyrimidine glycosylase/DNA-(apurinic or apyrimidinic site) lyase [Chloroflexi bacterium]|nr:bifunctional DNA-formamidopyrimidine glycosylase/DNA-(apurinic or apyrimidinic site) lyase [Chloroflexota bacterium]
MPELPEVETIARDLHQHLAGQAIVGVTVREPRVIDRLTPQEFSLRLTGQCIHGVGRRAKYIVMELESGDLLIVHLRMTGRLLLCAPDDPLSKHTHVVLDLEPGTLPGFSAAGPTQLRFVDTRKFGRLSLVAPLHLTALDKRLGPEPLRDDFTPQVLSEVLRGRRTRLKPFLLDQRRLAGLGNIYADESLFLAGLHPEREAGSLTPEEVARLHAAIRQVLAAAIGNRGTSLSDAEYRDATGAKGRHLEHLAVFRRTGQPCPRCGTAIQRIRLAGRSTHFCPRCQV